MDRISNQVLITKLKKLPYKAVFSRGLYVTFIMSTIYEILFYSIFLGMTSFQILLSQFLMFADYIKIFTTINDVSDGQFYKMILLHFHNGVFIDNFWI